MKNTEDEWEIMSDEDLLAFAIEVKKKVYMEASHPWSDQLSKTKLALFVAYLCVGMTPKEILPFIEEIKWCVENELRFMSPQAYKEILGYRPQGSQEGEDSDSE